MTSITITISNFLKNYKPFNSLTDIELKNISNEISVLHFDRNKKIFEINEIPHDYFYVVYSGSVNLSVISDAEETLLNKCSIGDIFGLRPFFAKNNYMMNAKSREDSIIYAIPIASFKPLLAKNSAVLEFLLEIFASTTPTFKDNTQGSFSDNNNYIDNQQDIQHFQTLEYSKQALTVLPNSTVQETAQKMTEFDHKIALIVENNFPIGIVTDHDFRTKIATGNYPILSTIDKIMSSPVLTIPENLSLAETQLLMLKYNVSSLCITEDGSDKSPIKGFVTEHDLVVAQGNNPAVLLKEVKKSKNSKDLKTVREKLFRLIQSSIEKNIPLQNIAAISGEITYAITKRAIELAIIDLGSPPTQFAWLSIGSQGRKEQVILSDQDSILIFENVEPGIYRDVKDYYLKLAKKVVGTIEKVGFTNSENEQSAANTFNCKSLNDWTKQYASWINTPGENTDQINAIYFDYEFVYGNLKLEESLSEIVFVPRKINSLFYDYLGNNALKNPKPLNFFKKFIREESVENKDTFDIKNRALLPLINAARLFIMSHNIKGINNTYLRFKQLAIIEPNFQELFRTCAESFIILSKFRVLEGLKNDSNGQYINLDEMSKIDKEKLKTALIPLEALEDLIKDRFQLTYFS